MEKLSVNKIVNLSQDILGILEILPSELKEAELSLEEVEEEINDINHAIELVDMNAYEGYQIYKELQGARRRRRELKNNIKLLNSLEGVFSQHDNMVKGVHKQIINCAQDSVKGNKYYLRKRDDLRTRYGKRVVGILKREKPSRKEKRKNHKQNMINKHGIPIK